MVFDFIPDSMKKEDSQFVGTFKIETPLAEDLYDMLAECQFAVGSDGNIKIDEGAVNSQIKSVSMMIRKSLPYIKSLDVEKMDGTKFSTYEEFRRDPDSRTIVIEVASVIFNGMRPSKN